jgi:small GTP-binding protein
MEMKIIIGDSSFDGINLDQNPIESPPIEIIEQGKQSVLAWFEATKKKLNEIKIILLGEPKAGKTSLLRRLKDGSFNENEVQTDGINIEHVHFKDCETFTEQKKLHGITAHFWDFGGQEIMNATHQFFLTNRSVYVLVLDARRDKNVATQIRQWVKRVKVTSGKSPIIIVANQFDVNPGFGFPNQVELQQEFPEIKYFIEASCSSGLNIDLIKQKLEELIPQAELFNTSIDERWINVKEQLQKETKSKHFLNEDRFVKICNKHRLKDKTARNNAINFLNDLGLVLHFEDLNLAAYYVLDPYWITYGVYQIVTSARAGQQKGEVNMEADLEYIVNQEEDKKLVYQATHFKKIKYDTNQRRFLVDILNQFKLCFYLPDRSGFIIPDLLDTQEPLGITKAIRSAGESIHFVYRYDYLPSSVLPNIMVDFHSKLQEKWRTGCVLEKDGGKALISTYQDTLTITVTGEFKKKREFMAVIRNQVDNINQKLSNKPTMLIPLPGVVPTAYADYEDLLAMENEGERYFYLDRYKPTKKQFEISELLEGIAAPDQMQIIIDGFKKANEKLDIISKKQDELKTSLYQQYQLLLQLPLNNQIADTIVAAVKEINNQQKDQMVKEVMQWIAVGFEAFSGEMDEKLEKQYNALKKTDNLEMKLKLSVPFINLFGIDLSTEVNFNVKEWATAMYAKHKLKIFELLGAFNN